MTRVPSFPPEAFAFVVAPMVRSCVQITQDGPYLLTGHACDIKVDASDLPFRLMCIKGGATMTYTQMYVPEKLEQDLEYRQRAINDLQYEKSLPQELRRPVIVQLGGRDVSKMVQAAQLFAPHCEGIGSLLPSSKTLSLS